MHTVAFAPIRAQVPLSRTHKVPTFSAITEEEALRAKIVYHNALLPELNFEIRANPETGNMSLIETPFAGTCIALTDEWDLPLSQMSLSPLPDVSYEVHYSK